MYLYRALDSCGATIDFLLSAKRDSVTAQRFLTKAVGGENPPEPRELRCPRLSASASHHPPLYQDKAVTPTPLKDIYTNLGGTLSVRTFFPLRR
jgi:hypothetical protein